MGSETTPRSIAQAPIWGLGRVVATELPKVWGGLVDLDGDNTPEVSAKQLLHILQTSDREDQIVLRQGHPYILRLVKSQKTPVSPQSIQLQPEATYAITPAAASHRRAASLPRLQLRRMPTGDGGTKEHRGAEGVESLGRRWRDARRARLAATGGGGGGECGRQQATR